MQLPNIDRIAARPAGTEVVAPAAVRVIPVAPVNPPTPAPETAGVVNDINPVVQAQAQEAAAKADPSRGGPSGERDWTQRQEAAPKQEEPPKEPLSKMLMDHMTAVWSASARVVEVWLQNNAAQNPAVSQQLQAQNQAINRQVDPMASSGVVAKEVLTYSPTQIRKTEKPE